MKKTDIALIVLIAAISVILSYWVGNLLFSDPAESVVTITYIDEVSPSITQPDEESFNTSALNPTVEVYVGQCSGTQEWDEGTKSCREKRTETENENANGVNSETNEEDTGD